MGTRNTAKQTEKAGNENYRKVNISPETLDWTYLKYKYTEQGAREKFEDICMRLIYEMNPKKSVHRIGCAQGDEGIDIMIDENELIEVEGKDRKIGSYQVYQCKYFVGKMDPSRWSKVKASYQTAVKSEKYKLTRWTLCISRTFTLEEYRKWSEWKEEQEQLHPDVSIELLDGDALIAKLKEKEIYDDVFDVENKKKLDKLYEHFYGPYDITREYKETGAPEAIVLLRKLQNDYYNRGIGKIDEIDARLTEIKKAAKEDQNFSEEQEKSIVSHAQYWMGMIYKNIAFYEVEDSKKKEAKEKAAKLFEKSKIPPALYELYVYYKKRRGKNKSTKTFR